MTRMPVGEQAIDEGAADEAGASSNKGPHQCKPCQHNIRRRCESSSDIAFSVTVDAPS